MLNASVMRMLPVNQLIFNIWIRAMLRLLEKVTVKSSLAQTIYL